MISTCNVKNFVRLLMRKKNLNMLNNKLVYFMIMIVLCKKKCYQITQTEHFPITNANDGQIFIEASNVFFFFGGGGHNTNVSPSMQCPMPVSTNAGLGPNVYPILVGLEGRH